MSLISLSLERSLWNVGIENVVGIDEAGRGPLAGPVVAAAVVFPPETWIDGVDDSKKLSEKKREELYSIILEKARSVSVSIVDHRTIDEINILNATHKAMLDAVENLTVPPHYLLVDGNTFKHPTLLSKAIIDGDALSFTIAAASIVAKVTRDRIMREYDALYPQYGFAKHKGYGTKSHREAIARYGLCDIHRRSFCREFVQERF